MAQQPENKQPQPQPRPRKKAWPADRDAKVQMVVKNDGRMLYLGPVVYCGKIVFPKE